MREQIVVSPTRGDRNSSTRVSEHISGSTWPHCTSNFPIFPRLRTTYRTPPPSMVRSLIPLPPTGPVYPMRPSTARAPSATGPSLVSWSRRSRRPWPPHCGRKEGSQVDKKSREGPWMRGSKDGRRRGSKGGRRREGMGGKGEGQQGCGAARRRGGTEEGRKGGRAPWRKDGKGRAAGR